MPKKEDFIVNDTKTVDERYSRAEQFEHEMLIESMVLNAQVYPHWIYDDRYFWYLRKTRKKGNNSAEVQKSYRLVDPLSCTNKEAFDHVMLAEALSCISGREVDSNYLPISDIKLELSPCRIEFVAFNKRWLFDESTQSCLEIPGKRHNWVISPDGSKAVFLRDYNLWLCNIADGTEHALTGDGELHYAYGVQPERVSLTGGFHGVSWCNNTMPEVLWSPDSSKILSVRVDERDVLPIPVTNYIPSDGSVRPICVATKYALPGDEHIAKYQILSICINTGDVCFADHPSIEDAVLWAGLFSGNRAWWSNDNQQAYFIDMKRGQTEAHVLSFNTGDGSTKLLFKEQSTTNIDLGFEFERPAYLLHLKEFDELVWFSERTGWAHLYLYNLTTGELKNPITSGEWLVREILYFYADERELLIQISGRIKDRDPYYREICRVHIDTGVMTTIVSGDHDCLVHKSGHPVTLSAISLGKAADGCCGVSSDGKYIVNSRSRADIAPVTELIDRSGRVVMGVENADTSGLPDDWNWPEPVKLLAADNETETYGLVFRPTGFSPENKYPVLDWAFNNSFYSIVPKGSFGCDSMGSYAYMSAMAYAELGFIVVVIDGRGSCYRDKSFHDHAYGRVHMGSDLQDHIAGIKQLSERYDYMDLTRVGITDVGGSNAPLYGLLGYPEFYHVGAVCSVWDVRLLTQGETYQGLPAHTDYGKSVLGNMAENLEGKLLLMHGIFDPFFHLSGFLQVVDALIKENKDFDLVVLPNGGHATDSNCYGLRRIWDYLVIHLQGEIPPKNFRLCNGIEFGMERLQSESN